MSLRLLRLWLVAAICGAGSVFAQSAPPPVMPEAMPPGVRPMVAPAATKAADGEILPSLQLADADIGAVLDLLEMLTGRTILRPQSLPPAEKITLQIKKPIPKSEAILALETLLSLNQIGVAPLGDKFLKVVALAQVKMEAPTLITGSTLDLPPSGKIAAKFFQLEFLQSNELMQQLPQILTQGMGGGVVLFDRANAVMITDTISNLQRVELLLKQIDHPNVAMPKPKFYSLKFSKASDIVQRLQTILQGQKMAAQVGMNSTTTLSADDRTNQVIIVADARLYPMFDDLIDKLDTKGDSNTHTEVFRLKSADCKTLSTLLNNLINGETTAAQKAGQQAQRNAQTAALPVPTPAAPNTPAAAAQQAMATAQSRLRAQAGAGGDAAAEFSPYITIIPDDRTNAIVVNGTPDDLRLIHELVDQMDIILPQVRIEVVIADVTLDDTDTTGIDALGFQVAANKLTGVNLSAPTLAISGGTASGNTTSSTYATMTPGGLAFGYSLTGILGLTTTPRKGKTQIISSTAIVASHNKKSSIFVGEQRPQITGYLNTGTTSTTVGGGYQSNVGQQQIGITLTVTPLIGDDGSVQLSIQTDVEEPLQDVIIDGNAQAHTSKRTTDSYVTAKSGEIIVLGGLQKTTDSTSTSRLGPIPIIGDLLGTRTKGKHRTDLIFFLRPLVLTNTPADNDKFMKRLDGMPHKEEVKTMLEPNAPATDKPKK
ncbi:MAG TPA: secretin N-terminal domain-containing protein [Opitutaceae bacterium]|nr:secretin N-terminal domain-containing protein [Opitutaceae bacterium]